MDIYGKKSQLEFSSWVYFTAWLWVGFSFRSRQTGGGGSEKTRDCKEEVAGSTAEPEPDSFYNQVLCLRGCTRGSETSQNPSGIASRPDAGQRSPAAAPRRSSTQKMCKPFPKSSLIFVWLGNLGFSTSLSRHGTLLSSAVILGAPGSKGWGAQVKCKCGILR